MNPLAKTGYGGLSLVPPLKGELAKKFGLPPFSVLSARDGAWQSRKKAWKRLGIRSEIGRGSNVLGHSEQSGNMDFYKLKRELEEETGPLSTAEAGRILRERGLISGMDSGAGRGDNLLGLSDSTGALHEGAGAYARRAEKRATPGGGGGPNSGYFKQGGSKRANGRAFNIGMNASKENEWDVEDEHGSGTSIFDPVLCELLYTWFSAPGHQVIDPFAGGSVRGIVAGALGRRYWGNDLSAPQIAANRAQVGILPAGAPVPEWTVGDSRDQIWDAPEADFVMSCPPYFDLEVYSEDANDLSGQTWDQFKAGYWEIIYGAAERLRNDRFAAFVVGDVRDENGLFRGLPDYTTACFRRAGLELYNTLILVTAVGSLSIRSERQFTMSRKAGITHQIVLIYVKGDPRRATDAATGTTYAERQETLKKQTEANRAAVSIPEDGE